MRVLRGGVLPPVHFKLSLPENLLSWEIERAGTKYAQEHYGIGRLEVIEETPLPRVLAG